MSQDNETCLYCGKRDDEAQTDSVTVNWVQCDECQKWAHQVCAKVYDVEMENWSCGPCVVAAARKVLETSFATPCAKQSNGEQSVAGVSKVSKLNSQIGSASSLENKSVQSRTGSTRAKNKIKLELELLEMNRKIQEEYEIKKFELLNRMNEIESDEESLDELNTLKQQRTCQWAHGAIGNQSHGLKSVTYADQNLEQGVTNSAAAVGRNETSFVAPQQTMNAAQVYNARSVMPRDLPTFSGKPEEWPLFLSSYENSTRLCHFSNDENLLRLQRALKGRALESVSSKLLVPDLVPEVISTLRMLFGRPDYIINSSISKLRAMPSVNINKLDSLIMLALELKNLTATIRATGLADYAKSPMLVQECVEKLPPQMRLDWAKHQIAHSSNSNDLFTLSEWLYSLSEAASSVTSNICTFNNQNKAHRVNFHEEKEKKGYERNLSCYYCGDGHVLTDCRKFKNLACADRWTKARELKLCFLCLKKHDLKFCKQKTMCQIGQCEQRHHALLHKTYDKRQGAERPVESTHHEEDKNNSVLALQHQMTSSVLYRVLPVTVYGSSSSCNIYAFCDDGSGPTIIEDEVLQKLNLDGKKDDLCLKWTNGTTHVEKDSKTLDLKVSPKGRTQATIILNNVRSVNKLGLPRQSLNMTEMCEKYEHLRGLPVESYKNVKPQMIIGLNNRSALMPLKFREGGPNEPAATKSRLGWTVFGVVDSEARDSKESLQLHICECDDDLALQALVTNSWKAEEVNASGDAQPHISKQMKRIQNSVKREGDKFVVNLLWKSEAATLQDNYVMALQRLKCFERKLSKEQGLKEYVDQHIESMVHKGYARKLSADEIAAEHPRKWYLPIFTVKNPNKPGKIRLVWDAAAKYNGMSLNDYLEKGPDMLNSLTAVLSNFRIGKYGVCGDICEMFHRVHVDNDDQQAQRFLWTNSEKQSPDVYVLTVLSFGASCSPALAQFVRNKNALEFSDDYPRAVKCIVERHYVDDMLDSVDSEEEAVKLVKEVIRIHKKGNFHIRNWLSNSTAVMAAFVVGEEQQKFCSAGKKIDQIIEPTKVLGMWWETTDDVFCFSLKFTKANEEILQGSKLPTKRELLRLLMSIFDPLGLLTFYLVDMKILFQQIWRCGVGWDDDIPKECADAWQRWLQLLPEVEKLKIPRHYFGEWSFKDCSIELHVFMDGGQHAFAAVGYLRIVNGSSVKVTFVGSRSKVTPLRPMSVPRIELMAAVLGARYSNIIVRDHDLKIDKVYYWTDSKTVLSWIYSDPIERKQFVTYRVGEIQESTEIERWRYVPTKLNPADLATKVTAKSKFESQEFWFNGPDFLAQEKESWPKQLKIERSNEEMRNPGQTHLVAIQVQAHVVFDYSRFSKWERLLRSAAYLGRFRTNWLNKALKKENTTFTTDGLTTGELQWGFNFVCRAVQNEIYKAEIIALTADRNCVLPKESALFKLSPYIDEDGLLRMHSRIVRAECAQPSVKHQIILPKCHRVTMLLIDWFHRKYKHVSHEVVINEIFQKFQISGLRRVFRSVRNACQFCKIRKACPQPPQMAELPVGRVSPFCRPFTHVGLDFFGPFVTTVGRRHEKRYGVVFTCLTCRAIHVELAYSLTMNSCIIVIRNFIARRGTPRAFYSDNGTNLKAAERELKDSLAELDFKELKEEFTTLETSWNFIPPGSPHMGGAWERMVRSVKQVMYQIVTPATKLSDEILHNLFLEVEKIVNCRPLTYLSLETADQEALTPNHFLLGASSGQKPPGVFVATDQFVKSSWRQSQYLADCFWKRWVAEVLPTLTRRTAWFHKVKPIQVGDVVVIVDPNSPRYSWPKGIVIDVQMAKDGQVRSAIVRTASGQYKRPATKLAVLDVKANNDGLDPSK